MECPYCGHENISGTDLCKHCGADLAGLDLPSEQAEGERRHFHDVALSDLEPQEPLRVSGDTTVADALQLMRAERHGAVFVVDGADRLIGIFTERDLLTKFALGERPIDSTLIADVMTSDPDSVTASSSFSSALYMMGSQGYRHVPLVDSENRLTGFTSVRGTLDYLRTHVLV